MDAKELQYQVEQFLYREARLLDEWRFKEWLNLFTADTRYWIPARESTSDPNSGICGEHELAIIDDDKAFLSARVERLNSDMAHAERPQSRTRHFVTNVQVTALDTGEVGVACNILVYQSRQERTEVMFVGRREDRLRREEGNWRIAQRKVVLDPTLVSRSISVFF